MILKLETFRDKLAGCWAGKNIGGVLGTPFEATRGVIETDFYTQDLTMGPPPNDDLDLQIVWLAAVERYGRQVNASILGDYWLSFVIPNWVEYGTGKANMRAGLVPPISGELDNTYKDSDGCFIRSEIWACLAPGHPEIATRYAFEDAIVDHASEGMYGEIFFAALQSSAFVESDPRTLIDIGLSYLPEDCAMARAIRTAVKCHDDGVEFLEARKIVHNTAPGTFGIQHTRLRDVKKEGNEGMVPGTPGFDAPENVAFAMLGWLYGDGDFGKSICLANSCGEDTDCTCASLGATMGIILGASALPKKWTEPLGDRIATLCIDKTCSSIWIPKTSKELSERVLRVTPLFLGREYCDIFAEGGMEITCKEKEELFCDKEEDYFPRTNGSDKSNELTVPELCALSPYVVRYDFPTFRVELDYENSAFFHKGEKRNIKVKVVNNCKMHQQQWAKITAYLPEGAQLVGPASVELPLNNLVGACAETEFEILTDMYSGSRLEFVIDVSLVGRHSSGAMKVVLVGK